MQGKFRAGPERGKFRQASAGFIGGEPTVRITQAEGDHLQRRLSVILPDETPRVSQSSARIAGHRGRVFQTANDPALQKFPGGARRAICLLTEGAAHGEEIVAGHDHGQAADRLCIHGVGMIANVDHGWTLPEFSRERGTEENKLVEISEPLGDERARETESTKKRFRTDDLGGNPGGGQSREHHDRESLHALLAIKRVIIDQQNHQDDVVPWPRHASARRNANAVRSG